MANASYLTPDERQLQQSLQELSRKYKVELMLYTNLIGVEGWTLQARRGNEYRDLPVDAGSVDLKRVEKWLQELTHGG